MDDAYIGGVEEGVSGRETYSKSPILVAVELGATLKGRGRRSLGRVRMAVLPDLSEEPVGQFVLNSVRLGEHLITDGAWTYQRVAGPWPDHLAQVPRYRHTRRVQKQRPKDGPDCLPHVHRVIALAKRWLLGTHQGAVGQRHLDAYLDSVTPFRVMMRSDPGRTTQSRVDVGPVGL